MLKSHNQSISKYSQPFGLAVLLLICFSAHANQSTSQNLDWSSVVKISFKNPETNLNASCSGVLINPTTAITSASCVLAEETGRQSNTAQVCATRAKSKPCLSTAEILTHSDYLGTQSVKSAKNLAYLRLKGRFNLQQHGIKIHPEITPLEFRKLTGDQSKLTQTYWVNHDR